MNITEWTAVILLSLGVLKMTIGIFSPRSLLDMKRNPFSRMYLKNKKARLAIILGLGLIMVYVSLMSNLTLAQWFVAGYTMLVIAASFLFFSDNVLKTVMGWFNRIPERDFRLFCLIMLVLEVVALYVILM